MPLTASVIDELKKVAGRDSVITAPNDLRIFERDGSIEGAVPDAIVLPSNTEQVAAVIKIAERHNGSITAKSKPGQGATFIVTLPVHQQHNGETTHE